MLTFGVDREVINDKSSFLKFNRIDETALAILDQVASHNIFDDDLLRSPVLRDMRAKITDVIAAFEQSDLPLFLKKQNWLSRFTGADIEARLRFEADIQIVFHQMRQLQSLAGKGGEVLTQFDQARQGLLTEQTYLDEVIEYAQIALTEAPSPDEYVRARFERRLSNIMAVHASNILTLQHLAVARQLLQSLLDRVLDVQQTLFPLWQHNILALVHTTGSERRSAGAIALKTQNQLLKKLQQD